MYIYTLFYDDLKMYNRSVWVAPNDETAKKGMKLNLMDKNAERFRNEVNDGHVNLVKLKEFTEENGIIENGHMNEIVCNLKELLDDNNGNLAEPKQDNAK